MSSKITKTDSYTIVEILSNKIDAQIAPTIKAELTEIAATNEKNIILDLSNCGYCDSSGLSAILLANRLCKNAGGTCVLCGLQHTVERLLAISQLDSILIVAPDLKRAEEEFTKK
ncbi:MAG: STAS domain-containing protein [Bacteroidales bacterium]|jgi:anti-anti-sigma factor|nr:STAS domain-containing protein [Bacteroidales bacterium]